MAFDWLLDTRCRHAQNRHTFYKVDIMLHLFPNIAAVEISRRCLFTMHRQRSHALEHVCDGDRWNYLWEHLYTAIADLIPVIDVRLGRDEEAYRFIYQEAQNSYPWNFGLRDPSFTAQTVNALWKKHRSFEEMHYRTGLGHQVVLTLLAIKALRLVQDVQNISISGLIGKSVGGKVIPQEMIDNICKYLGTDFLANLFGIDLRKATSDATWTRNKIWEMKWVVTKSVYNTARSNKHIWRLMLDTDRFEARSEFGQFSTETGWDAERMAEVVAVRQYQTWMETPGSFDILRTAMAAAASWASAKYEICWPIERLWTPIERLTAPPGWAPPPTWRIPPPVAPSPSPPRKMRRTRYAWARTSVADMPEFFHYHYLLRDDSGCKSGFE